MRKRHSSAYLSDHPLWTSVAPQYQALLSTPLKLKVFSASSAASGFEEGIVSIPHFNPAQLIVATRAVHRFALEQVSLSVGYAALHQLSEDTPALASPRQYVSINSPDKQVLLRFDTEAAAEDWTKALEKLLAAVNQQGNPEHLGCLFDVTMMPSPSQNWCELRLCLVTNDGSTEEFVLCELSEPSAENRLRQIEQRLGGTFDCMSAEVLRSCLEDTSIHRQLQTNQKLYDSMQTPSVPSLEQLKNAKVKAVTKLATKKLDTSKGQMALRIALSEFCFAPKEPLSKAFHILHAQKLQTMCAAAGGKQLKQPTRTHNTKTGALHFEKLLSADNNGLEANFTQKPRVSVQCRRTF